MKSWLTEKEAAEYLGMSIQEFRQIDIELPGKDGKGQQLFSIRDLNLWKWSHEQKNEETNYIIAPDFALAHFRLIQAILLKGIPIPTDYDKVGELPSLDLPVMIEVTKPWDPPIFSKCVWDSPEGLFTYRDELLYGIHDHLIENLSYTYHSRIGDQLDKVKSELHGNPNSRRAQFITWQPEIDLGSKYPPCFQRGWFRVRNEKLDFHTHWRSRDMLKAWGSNVFAFAHLHKLWADELGISVGIYREFIDSAHIYGRDLDIAKSFAQRSLDEWSWPLEEIDRLASSKNDTSSSQ